MAVRDGFILGRIAECDLVIDDGKASRRHARILVEAGVVEIEDLGSSNGTLLNGKPVTRRVLRSGDEVQIGKTVITFREGVMPGSAPVAGSGGGSGVLDDDDDNDLFADSSPGSPAASERTPPAAPPAPPLSTAPVPRPAPPAANVPPPAPPTPTPPPPRTAVVEFADEVIEVRKPAPAASPARSAGASSAQPVQKQSRVLQYSKQAAASSVLGDDLSQVSGGTRTLLYAVVLAIAIGLGWLVMRLVG